MFYAMAVDTLSIDVDAECTGVNFCVHWLLTLCVLLKDALHIDVDAFCDSC